MEPTSGIFLVDKSDGRRIWFVETQDVVLTGNLRLDSVLRDNATLTLVAEKHVDILKPKVDLNKAEKKTGRMSSKYKAGGLYNPKDCDEGEDCIC